MELPKINEVYTHFDDGKICTSRAQTVKIIKIIPFNNMENKDILKLWKSEKALFNWLYKETTSHFIIGNLTFISPGTENFNTNITYVEAYNNIWFSLGYWGGTLDLDGKLLKQLKKDIK